ncbi:MAG: MoaD/ThiS family protein [Peptococcaceae bacterium]|nr:MoaD/ThiS family protein [Peptococcaceae bacterium]
MHIELRVYTGLEKYVGVRHGEMTTVAIDGTLTIADLLHRFDIPPAEVTSALVNGRHKELDYRLQDKDRVSLFPPVGGG